MGDMRQLELLEERHPHPLTFIEGKINSRDGMFCCACQKALYPPAFICSSCPFYIHQSCIPLPSEISTPFHPHHSLSRADINSDYCHCCSQIPRDCLYTCRQHGCKFVIDIKCALADTQIPLNLIEPKCYQHFSHSHPLIFEAEITTRKLVICKICELVLFGPVYFCSLCDIGFHEHCAQLPRKVYYPDHKDHPLFLFPLQSAEPFCNCCKNRCWGFVYSCVESECDFNLHVMCLLSSQPHQHKFTRLRTKIDFLCWLCGWKRNSDFPWFCSICHILAHKECAELPLSLSVNGHRGPLNFTYAHPFEDQSNLACEICRKKVEPQYAAYSCSKCSYIVHLSCAGTYYLVEEQQDSLEDAATLDNFGLISKLHSNCEQKLNYRREVGDNDKQCHGCMQCHQDAEPSYSYSCDKCGFFLHKDCADLPIKNRHPLHNHTLTLITIQDVAFQCHACLQLCHGFAYHCEGCHYTLDIRCALIKTKKLEHPIHLHPLSLAQNEKPKECRGCHQSSTNVFECNKGCNFSLDYRCATLPQKVRCRFDGDLMDVSLNVENEKGEYYCVLCTKGGDLWDPSCNVVDETGEYYCDVCEEERNRNACFYRCKTCHLAAHPECILGEYPWLKYGSYESHKHLLALVTEGKTNYSDCEHCGRPCTGNLAYECRCCKFNVHAIGHCYHEQIFQRKLSFKIKSQLKNFSLGPFGGKDGKPWNYAFWSIRQFVIHHRDWIHSIQMEYENTYGKLVWSKKHGDKDEGFRSEVVLEFPDEHFVSIHGYYSDLGAWGNPSTVIRSLTLKTNRRTCGPFGVEDGTKFSFLMLKSNIVGVYGRSGWYLDAIGFHLETTQESKVEPEPAAAPQFQLECSKLQQYGGDGGDAWEDTFSTMRRFVVYHGHFIDCIQIQYEDDNENVVWSNKHGGDGGSRTEVVLEFPDEYLVSIHGYYGDASKWGVAATVIQSLTLETNKKIYGPFGFDDGSKFSVNTTAGQKVVGIRGRSGKYLDAIGLSVVTIQDQLA